MNPPFSCDHGAATHSCIMHDTRRGTLCKNAAHSESEKMGGACAQCPCVTGLSNKFAYFFVLHVLGYDSDTKRKRPVLLTCCSYTAAGYRLRTCLDNRHQNQIRRMALVVIIHVH